MSSPYIQELNSPRSAVKDVVSVSSLDENNIYYRVCTPFWAFCSVLSLSDITWMLKCVTEGCLPLNDHFSNSIKYILRKNVLPLNGQNFFKAILGSVEHHKKSSFDLQSKTKMDEYEYSRNIRISTTNNVCSRSINVSCPVPCTFLKLLIVS